MYLIHQMENSILMKKEWNKLNKVELKIQQDHKVVDEKIKEVNWMLSKFKQNLDWIRRNRINIHAEWELLNTMREGILPVKHQHWPRLPILFSWSAKDIKLMDFAINSWLSENEANARSWKQTEYYKFIQTKVDEMNQTLEGNEQIVIEVPPYPQTGFRVRCYLHRESDYLKIALHNHQLQRDDWQDQIASDLERAFLHKRKLNL